MRWAWIVSLLSCTGANGFLNPPGKLPVVQSLLKARPHVRPDSPSRDLPRRSTSVLFGDINFTAESADSSSLGSMSEDDLAVASLPLPPKDDTYSRFPFNVLREIRSFPFPPDGSARFDKIGKKTGGIWKSKFLGFLPVTVLTSTLATPWLLKEEAKGNVIHDWPESVLQLLGPKAIATVGDKTSIHGTLRGLYYQALSPQIVVKMVPFVESCLAKRAKQWDQMAKSGEEMCVFDDLSSFTMEIIIHAFLGDCYEMEKILEKSLYLIPEVVKGLFTIPQKFWWPLNRLFPFNFGPAMKARKEFDTIIKGIIEGRRSALATGDNASTGAVLDSMLEMQAKQRANGGPKTGEMEYDDTFICDNIITALFAGFETTSSTLTRILQHLELDESKELGLKERLLEELKGSLNPVEERVGDVIQPSVATGIFRAFPLMDAVVLESNRMAPAVGGAFRKAKKSLRFNGYLIPEGESVNWSLASGYVSESLYPKHTKFCPFRFLQSDIKNVGGSPSTKDALSPAEAHTDQPRPLMFGYGKHLCPGKELAKLEILLFLKFFLPKYEYRLVEGQDLRGSFARGAPRDGLRVTLTRTCA